MELKCPTCNALLYSRRARLCGHCNAVLPEELHLSDEEARARDEAHALERASARKLADAFGAQLSGANQRSETALSAAELIARAETADTSSNRDFADQFKHRKRKSYWFYLGGFSLLVVPVIWFVTRYGGLPPQAWLAILGVIAVPAWSAWLNGSPICPHCHKNIRTCPPAHCHICGDSLHDNACSPCGVDYSWWRLLRPTVRGSRA